jgi:hypothetical protein
MPPLAAQHVGGDVLVATLDVTKGAVRALRIAPDDKVTADRAVLSDVAISNDSDLKLAAAAEGAFVTWRGLRGGKLVRELVGLGADLEPKGAPIETPAASCAVGEGLWSSNGSEATLRRWPGAGGPTKQKLPADKDTSLLCGPHRAYAVIDEEDRTAFLPLGAEAGAPVTLLREHDFGDDEQRELAEFAVGSDVGVVRLGGSGSLALRELRSGSPSGLHKLKTAIGRDDDVVAVDASPRMVLIVYTVDDAGEPDSADSGAAAVSSCTKVGAIRVDRTTFEESSIELAPARCGFELGPYFTNALGDGVAVAWPERSGGAGRPRAPIVGMVHTVVASAGTPAIERMPQSADAIVDAGCDDQTCFAAALVRREPSEPAEVKILRYR